nr:hypothetical protein CFP56_11510 [Quercus suber]
MATTPATKKQRTHPKYELLYHPTIPGRGEFIRLAFEAAGVPYTDVANEHQDGYSTVQAICMNDALASAEGNPPVFAPPALRIPSAGRDGQQALIIHQTPAILAYLGERLDLVPADEAGRAYVQQLALTALDLNNEAHDTHHPIAAMQYYEDQKGVQDGYSTVQAICMNDALASAEGNPPVFAPPALRIPSAGRDGQQALIIHQTPAILAYLGERLDLVPADEAGRAYVQQLALTALDLNNEAHDTHHPIAAMQYYEDQKGAALAKAADVRAHRLPKFFSYFQRTLLFNQQSHGGAGTFLVGDQLTYADTTLWQVLDGLYFAFPREMEVRKKEFGALLEGFYGSFKETPAVKGYLDSDRRLDFGMGVYRHYPELDRQ